MDTLQWMRVPLVTALTALPHHGVVIFLGVEDGELSRRTDLALRQKLHVLPWPANADANTPAPPANDVHGETGKGG